MNLSIIQLLILVVVCLVVGFVGCYFVIRNNPRYLSNKAYAQIFGLQEWADLYDTKNAIKAKFRLEVEKLAEKKLGDIFNIQKK